jgi:hypothetical protein
MSTDVLIYCAHHLFFISYFISVTTIVLFIYQLTYRHNPCFVYLSINLSSSLRFYFSLGCRQR